MARGDFNTSQFGQNTRGNAVSDRELETAIVRVLATKLGLSERTVQQLQELAGQRGEASLPKAAVRRSDIASIARIQQIKSQDVSATPTADEFNALRADVRRLFEALEIIAKALKQS